MLCVANCTVYTCLVFMVSACSGREEGGVMWAFYMARITGISRNWCQGLTPQLVFGIETVGSRETTHTHVLLGRCVTAIHPVQLIVVYEQDKWVNSPCFLLITVTVI